MGNENGRRSGGNIECPKLANMMAAAGPNHALTIPQFFFLIGGKRSFSSKEVAMKTIVLLRLQEGDTPEILEEKTPKSDWAESLFAMLWASEKGFLDPVILQEVPENPVMNFTICQIEDKLGSGRVPATVSPERAGSDEATLAQMEMMAASSLNLVSILTKMQDGNNKVDKSKKEAEKSILKAMGPTQHNLFMALCTEEMDVIPDGFYDEPDQLLEPTKGNQPPKVEGPRLGRDILSRSDAQAPLKRFPLPGSESCKSRRVHDIQFLSQNKSTGKVQGTNYFAST